MRARCLLILWACAEALSAKVRTCKQSQNFDAIFSGRVEELFGQTSALINIKRVIKGDSRYQGHFIILENVKNCHNVKRVKLRDTRIFSAKLIEDGVFELVSPLWPVTLTNLRRANFIAQKIERRQHRRSHSHNKSGKIIYRLTDRVE